MLGLLDMKDMQKLLDEVIRERDELIAEVQRVTEERDDAIEHADCEMQFAETLKKERDEARRCAEQMRDLYAAEVDESIEAFPWPWEVNDE